MNKQELLDELIRSREDFMRAIAGLTDEQRRTPGACGIWSVKDVLAHLAAWQSELVTAINQVENGQRPTIIDIDDIHEWNAEQYHNNASRLFPQIEMDFIGVHRILLKRIKELDEKTLFDRWQFDWMEGEPFSYLIQETTSWHEQEHIEDILKWREEKSI